MKLTLMFFGLSTFQAMIEFPHAVPGYKSPITVIVYLVPFC